MVFKIFFGKEFCGKFFNWEKILILDARNPQKIKTGNKIGVQIASVQPLINALSDIFLGTLHHFFKLVLM